MENRIQNTDAVLSLSKEHRIQKTLILILCLIVANLGVAFAQPYTVKRFSDYPRLAQGNKDVLLLVLYDPNGVPTTYSVGLEELLAYRIPATLTDGGILIGNGTGALVSLGVATNGQIPIGDGTTDPVLATITEGSAIDVTNGAGTITVIFDPTEITGGTTWDDGGEAFVVWTWNLAAGDPNIIFGNGFINIASGTLQQGGVAVSLSTHNHSGVYLGMATYDVSADGHVDGNDLAYGAAWNGDVNAPSMNAVYDEMETRGKVAGDNWTGTHDMNGVTLTLPSRQKKTDHHFLFNLPDPNGLYAKDTHYVIDPNIDAAITITDVTVTCDADPATEIAFDLKFADAFIGLAGATKICSVTTAAGVAHVTTFDDATVPANKCIYLEWTAAPISAITQTGMKIRWDYD